MVFMIVFLIVNTPQTDASHRRTGTTRAHQHNMHYGITGGSRDTRDEEYCVDSQTSSITDASALSKVDYAFFSTGTPKWDGTQSGTNTADWRVELWGMTSACTAYTQTQRDAIEIEMHVYKTNAGNCGSEDWSCVKHYGAIQWTPPAGSNKPIHTDYKWEWIYFDYDNLWVSTGNDNSSRTINHEVGHILGLFDGPGSSYCSPTSLMHNIWYGCTYNGIVPTLSDLDSVRAGSNGD